MTLQASYGQYIMLPPSFGSPFVGAGTHVLDALNEELHFVGYVHLDGGSAAGSKTISSAGGKVHWNSSTVTFADAGTTLRIGLQDVSAVTAPAQGDGTFDVYDDLVGGTDTINASLTNAAIMSVGTKSLSHGQMVAIAFKLTARGGADTIRIRSWLPATYGGATQLPCSMLSTVGTFARQTGVPDAVIEFDDGTLGWLAGSMNVNAQSSVAFNLDSAADEYGNLITLPFPVRATGIHADFGPASSSSDFEFCLYSDPLGTPALIEAVAVDATKLAHSTAFGTITVPFLTERVLAAGTYAFTIRPTTTGNITFYYLDVADARFWRLHGFSDNCYAVNRTGNTGAFADHNGGTAKTRRMWASLVVDKFNDAAGNAQYFMGI